MYSENENTEVYCDICVTPVDIDNLCEHFVVENTTATSAVAPLGGHGASETETSEVFGINCFTTDVSSYEELLIGAIEQRPVLWDPNMRVSDKTKTSKDNAWSEIYKFLNCKYSIDVLKKKWKNLKDTYIRVKGEMESYTASGSEAPKRKRCWKHYESLKFLSDKQSRRRTSTNLPETPSTRQEVLSDADSGSSSKKKINKRIEPDRVEDAILEAIKNVPQPPPFIQQEKKN